MSELRTARVDLGAISGNVTLIRERAATPVMAVVKANGYGHGAVESARAALAGGATWLGVVDIDEAVSLRRAGFEVPILSWLHAPDVDFTPAIAERIDIGVNYLDQLERVAAASGLPEVHLKVDTGLSRNGAIESEWATLFARAAELERLGRLHVRGIFSHLANASEQADAEQVALFERAVAQATEVGLAPEVRHLAATAGALARPASRFDLVRVGIGAYGLSPFDAAPVPGLVPAMTLSANVAAVKRISAGSGVSYGHAFVAGADTTLALVPLGYADGIPRQASGRAGVSIDGTIVPVVGRIAMDQFMVDVGDAAVSVGARAVLFGDPATGVPSADDWAAAADTINYELVTRIGPRVTRVYS
ncbi:alanine racemase [soil metagenome]